MLQIGRLLGTIEKGWEMLQIGRLLRKRVLTTEKGVASSKGGCITYNIPCFHYGSLQCRFFQVD